MAILIRKQSNLALYLLDSGKIVTLATGTETDDDIPVLSVSDATFTKLTTAYGAAI